MPFTLNTILPYESFLECWNSEYYVDKSNILIKLNSSIKKDNKYICITRPRRFGKTVMANLIASYYSKGVHSKEIFDKLNISKSINYKKYIIKYNVIFINFSETSDSCNSYDDYIGRIKRLIFNDLIEKYPDFKPYEDLDLWDNLVSIYQKIKEGFIFIFDEWD